MAQRVVLKPEERAARDREEVAAWDGMKAHGATLRREAMAKTAAERKEAGLPAEEPRKAEGPDQ